MKTIQAQYPQRLQPCCCECLWGVPKIEQRTAGLAGRKQQCKHCETACSCDCCAATYRVVDCVSSAVNSMADLQGLWTHALVLSIPQVGCNLSIAGSESAGGRWWKFTCGLTTSPQPPPDEPELNPSANKPSAITTPSGHQAQHTARIKHPKSSQTFVNSKHILNTNRVPNTPGLGKTLDATAEAGSESVPANDDSGDGSSGGYASCGPAVQGPMLVVVLERVQSGLLGAALSAFGITGLYFSVVFGEFGDTRRNIHCDHMMVENTCVAASELHCMAPGCTQQAGPTDWG